MKSLLSAALALALAAPAAAQPAAAPLVQHPHAAWTRNASIYEVNVRQFSPAGNFAGVEAQLPRLQKLGVKILWIMPIHPIGVKERKGELGSYYAVRDYKAVNPEYGSLADFQRLVRKAHALGMKVIIDWVANHSAWDNAWVSQHPDWYKKDEKGKIISVRFGEAPNYEYWTDVVALDYSKPELRAAMLDAMRFWVRNADIDGFRCDVAELVPIDFWVSARAELEKSKPLFFLAEGDKPFLHQAFDMSYDWKLLDRFAAIAEGKETAQNLRDYVSTRMAGLPRDAYRMTFTSNHDINSWRFADKAEYGPRFPAFAVLAATLPGMPLIYSGQESGLDKKLEFFKRDPIAWKSYANAPLYRTLVRLKAGNPALRNGDMGAPAELLDAGNRDIFAFRRQQGGHWLTVAVNLSDRPVAQKAIPGLAAGRIAPWQWRMASR
ncbi:alpha-amylase [Sphingomonas ginkgonis]|uniref:Alpha-amylase n=1 Tax=Sphingomonas ginkgonis TaxID=2315330 RepID=A0A3R9X6W2_9SPHN|nr:alpha-amylase family glycosyl hydrolase [Sphingomonas ginkgonis]RST30244.1 alpha-amylase [Sphingomonas ginkgonis]